MWRGEIQARLLGMRVEVFDADGRAVIGEKGELVCTMPFPSMPVGFWNDPDGSKYRAAYFSRYPGVWHHGDYVEITPHDGVIIYGRSDAVLNPGGVRIGTAEIYRQVEQIPDVLESVVIGQQWSNDERIVLFVRLRDDRVLSPALEDAIRQQIRPTRRRGTCRRGYFRSPTSRGRAAARSSSWPCGTSCTDAQCGTSSRCRIRRRWRSSVTGQSFEPSAAGQPIERVAIAAAVLATIVAHARETAPAECCGLLVGRPAGGALLVDEAVTARNLAEGTTRYLIDPAAHFALIKRLRGTGRDVVGAYHSHPRSPAVPSSTDVDEAVFDRFLYVIVSLGSSEPDVRAWRILDGASYRVDVDVR